MARPVRLPSNTTTAMPTAHQPPAAGDGARCWDTKSKTRPPDPSRKVPYHVGDADALPWPYPPSAAPPHPKAQPRDVAEMQSCLQVNTGAGLKPDAPASLGIVVVQNRHLRGPRGRVSPDFRGVCGGSAQDLPVIPLGAAGVKKREKARGHGPAAQAGAGSIKTLYFPSAGPRRCGVTQAPAGAHVKEACAGPSLCGALGGVGAPHAHCGRTGATVSGPTPGAPPKTRPPKQPIVSSGIWPSFRPLSSHTLRVGLCAGTPGV